MDEILGAVAGIQPEGWLAGSSALVVAYCAVELARQPLAAKTSSSPLAPRWELFGVFNVAAVLAAAAAAINLWRSPPSEDAMMFRLGSADARAIVSALSLLVVATYMIAYCGVSMVWRAIEEDSSALLKPARVPVSASRMSAARRERLRKDGMDADVIIVGAGTAGAALAAVLARQGKHVIVVERSEDIPVSPRRTLAARPRFTCQRPVWSLVCPACPRRASPPGRAGAYRR